MREVTLAATQMACGPDRAANVVNAKKLVRAAKAKGAQIILIQELFETPYFCKDQAAKHFALAEPFEKQRADRRIFQSGARTECCSAGQLFRAREQCAFQLFGDDRRRRLGAGQLPQVAYSGRSGLSGKILFQPRRHGLQGLAHAVRHNRRRHLLGSMVSRGCARDGVDGG